MIKIKLYLDFYKTYYDLGPLFMWSFVDNTNEGQELLRKDGYARWIYHITEQEFVNELFFKNWRYYSGLEFDED